MTERYIPGVPCWADATYRDAAAAADFYRGLFGWELEDTMPSDRPGHYFQARLDGGRVAAVGSIVDDVTPTAEPAWVSYVWVDDADATTEIARRAGAAVIIEPTDIPGSGRLSLFADPQGAVIGLWQPGDHRGATTINQHGSVVFNDLYTTDLDAAAAFYRDVFGWGIEDTGGITMWTMAAYGDHLETLQPGLRDQMAQMGAPGFENVVASVQTTDGPARWGITFAVDDVETSTARAVELGATLLSGPTQTSWVIEAELRDPQGAPFTLSQFGPEG